MKKVKKDEAISKIKATDPLEVSLTTISRDASESQKKLEIDKVIRTLREYVAEQRGAVVCLVKEK
jgi:hypothetical protein